MLEWLNTLTWSEKFFWVIAVVSTLIFLFVWIGSLFDKKNIDSKSDFQFFKLKNCVAFLTVFGWVGIASLYQGFSLIITLIIAFICGIVIMFVMTALFYYVRKMTEGGTLEFKNELNSRGRVVLKVGKSRSQIGKIEIKIGKDVKIMDAITDFQHDLETGTLVQIESAGENGILIVKPLQ